MRIVGGRFKGRALASVGKGDTNAHLRPTTDRVRESIFNLLVNGGYDDPIKGARVLDLFAGTGALGCEAMSRGASFVQFVDDGKKSQTLIRQNINALELSNNAKLYRRNAIRLGAVNTDPFDLIFLDPPYGKELGQQALLSAQSGGWLSDNALIMWEDGAEQIAPTSFEMLDIRNYGNTWVHILRFKNTMLG